MTAPHRTRPETGTAPSTRRSDLSLTKISATALAAITAAVLGSHLSVAGTLIGAALASVITTVSTSFYQASLDRSRERMRVVNARTLPTRPPRTVSGRAGLDPPTIRLDRSTLPSRSAAPRRGLNWAVLTGATLAAFTLAITLITGFEMARGESLGGNGDGPSLARLTDSDAVQPGGTNPDQTPPVPESADPAAPSTSPTTPDPSAPESSDTSHSDTKDDQEDRSPEDPDTRPTTTTPPPQQGILPGLLP